jgi:L-glyceraldehyde 3-phosphate reductase
MAETLFGLVLAREFKAYRDELVVATKAGHAMWPGPYGDWGSRKHLIAGLDQSLRRLRLDYVDLFYHHRPDPATPLEETVGAWPDRPSGKAPTSALQISADELRRAAPCACGGCRAWAPVRYNLIDRADPRSQLAPRRWPARTVAFSRSRRGALRKYGRAAGRFARGAGSPFKRAPSGPRQRRVRGRCRRPLRQRPDAAQTAWPGSCAIRGGSAVIGATASPTPRKRRRAPTSL